MDYIQKIETERLRLDRIALDDPELSAEFRRHRRIAFVLKAIVIAVVGYGSWHMWQWAEAAPIEKTAPWVVGLAVIVLALNALAPRLALKIAGIR